MITTAVILAAGIGKRLELYEKPKGFLNIGGRPLIEYSIRALKQHKIERIIIGTGFKNEYYDELAEYVGGVVTCKNDRFMTHGSLSTLCCLKELVQGDFLLLEADILYDAHCIGTLLSDPRPNVLLMGRSANKEDGVFVQTDDNRQLITMSKEIQSLPSMEEGILVGITKISAQAFRELMEIAPKVLEDNPHEYYDFAFERIVSKFHVLLIDKLIFTEIDTDEQLRHAVNYVYPKLSLPYRLQIQDS